MTGKKNNKKRVLLIGPAPQNVGGISMHLRRLMATMKGLCEFDFVDEGHKRYEGYFNMRSLNIFTYLKKVFKADVVHINSGAFSLRLINAFICRIVLRKYTVVTIHRDPTIESHVGMTRFVLSRCNEVIAVNKNGYNLLKTERKCNYHLLPAFLPPIMKDDPPLEAELQEWIEKARSTKNSLLMVSNASSLVFLNGEDVYGIDQSLEAVKALRDKGINCFLIFVIVQCNFPDVLAQYKKFVVDNALEEYILLLEKPCSFVRLMDESDIVLRTTNTDGDSISVREALALGVPIIASDVVERPEGTILFKTRDVDSLVEVIANTSNKGRSHKVDDMVDYSKVYSNIYKL